MKDAIYSLALVAAGGVLGMVGTIHAIGLPELHQPALIGFNCEGAGGPLYADSEDYFPQCQAIERTADVFDNEEQARGHDKWGNWELVGEVNGQSFVIDYGLSQEDCNSVANVILANQTALDPTAYDVLYCEDKGAA